MIGKRYSEVIHRLVALGNWSITADEEGWSELSNMLPNDHRVLNIEHENDIITACYRVR